MPSGAGVTKNNKDAPRAGPHAIWHAASAHRVFPKEPSMRQKYVLRKSRLLKRAILCLLATLIVLLTFTLRPHFGQTTFNYGDALEKAIWFFDANRCGPSAATDNVFS